MDLINIRHIFRNLIRKPGFTVVTVMTLALGIAANAVILLNPNYLILTGGLTRAGDILLDPFRESLRRELPPYLLDDLRVEVSSLGEEGGALGMAGLVLTRLYDMPVR